MPCGRYLPESIAECIKWYLRKYPDEPCSLPCLVVAASSTLLTRMLHLPTCQIPLQRPNLVAQTHRDGINRTLPKKPQAYTPLWIWNRFLLSACQISLVRFLSSRRPSKEYCWRTRNAVQTADQPEEQHIQGRAYIPGRPLLPIRRLFDDPVLHLRATKSTKSPAYI